MDEESEGIVIPPQVLQDRQGKHVLPICLTCGERGPWANESDPADPAHLWDHTHWTENGQRRREHRKFDRIYVQIATGEVFIL